MIEDTKINDDTEYFNRNINLETVEDDYFEELNRNEIDIIIDRFDRIERNENYCNAGEEFFPFNLKDDETNTYRDGDGEDEK